MVFTPRIVRAIVLLLVFLVHLAFSRENYDLYSVRQARDRDWAAAHKKLSESRMRQLGQRESGPREIGPREIGPRQSTSITLYFGDEDAIFQSKKEEKTADTTYAKSSAISGHIRKLINHTHITNPLGSKANQLQVPAFQRLRRKQIHVARPAPPSQVLPESDTDSYDEPEDTQPASKRTREGDASHLVVVPHHDQQQEHAKGFLSKFRSSPQ